MTDTQGAIPDIAKALRNHVGMATTLAVPPMGPIEADLLTQAADEIDRRKAICKDLAAEAQQYYEERNRLTAQRKELREALDIVRVELAALVKDPSNPDFTQFLDNNNLADAECLEKAFNATRTALDNTKGDA